MERTPNESLENKRFKLIRLIKLAKEEEARGIVFDFYFKNNSNIDLLFCQALDTASENKLKILVGFDFEIVKGKFCRGAVAKNLKGSLPKANQGHLMGYGEWDGKIRSLPLFFKNDTTLPALSYKLAEHVSKVKGPKSRLLQFIKPSEDPIILDYEELVFNKENWPLVRDRYLLVGEKSLRDRFSTPFGETAGVLIHAYAAHSLIENHYIKRVSWISYFLTIFIFCFLLTVWFVHGVSIKGLFVRNILFSVILFLIAVFLICFALIWFEIIYSLVAIWVYLPLLIGLKKITN
jgi:CHASE2 domain-containing sensor protein